MRSLLQLQDSEGLVSILVNEGLLELELANQSQQAAKRTHTPITTYLVMNSIVTSNALLQCCARTFNLRIFNLDNIDKSWVSFLNLELIQRYHFIPLKKENNILHIGVSDPTCRQVLEIVSFYTGMKTSLWLVDEYQLNHMLTTAHTHSSQTTLEQALLNEFSQEETPLAIHDNSVNYDEPLIRFVDHIIEHALQQASSDIHIEPYETTCRIRYRKDGLLYQVAEIPIKMAERLATRLKVMSRLDISERRLPQDGRFQLNQTDIRINTCPTLFGEKIVMRLLPRNQSALSLSELGLNAFQYQLFKETLSNPQGLILVTGPTGSGKTITLYSALNFLNTMDRNISTVEDPIEIKLAGINQVNINPKIKLDFATTLRTFLRQDPDIIMVGEIRDSETAEIAIQAAQTGHLVLSTLHTNNTIEALTRLSTMGIPRYNLTSSLTLTIAQRLIRKLCDRCKQPEILTAATRVELNLKNAIVFKAIGCQYCLHGYQGRIGIYELLPMTDQLTALILSDTDTPIIRTQLQQEGFIPLKDAGLEKVREGLTSLNELMRVAPK